VTSTVRTGLGALDVRSEGTGPVAVFWHSLFVDDRSWDRVAPTLAGQRRLIRITGPGHGRSTSTVKRYDLDDCAAAALTVLDSLGIAEPVDWVGNAWGGHVGIVLAATAPERIRTLAAFNAPVQALSSTEARAPRLLASLFGILGAIGLVREGVTAALLSERSREQDPVAVAYVHECLRNADRTGLVRAIRSISLKRPDLSPLLPSITAPTLLVTSPEDTLWTPDQVDAAAALMSDAQVAVIEGSGHLTPFEVPDETIALVTKLWTR